MSSVVRRTFCSTPQRDAMETWTAIVDLLTQGKSGTARTELLAVGGIAASLIADQGPKDAAIVTTCDGPRTRIYCLYDDDAIDGSDANEDSLGFDPLTGDWQVSLPCQRDDLTWVQAALKKHSSRVVARDVAEAITPANSDGNAEAAQTMTLDPKGFLGS
ncbi:hypothetical protein ACYG9R_19195 [Mesorhizobium sp. RSR565B]|uniref:hypothetical protein n=1 Tax=unclassified Mesorhizobium TaxID=325217 RepID=UPI0003CF59AC|nr:MULTISPECIES: hypothetical protein [unclassified Mesorhizobium]ESY07320.1 hypothetical protein X753_00460 [Mesorhizobium sp. LNJC399B00]ESZ43595.1 hypothetical protein X730_27885 [Mesorhizobium sp. L103C565B0]WJI70627.1 hypothetical protein NLY36_07480 [Mesorhizobium sp. C399B]